ITLVPHIEDTQAGLPTNHFNSSCDSGISGVSKPATSRLLDNGHQISLAATEVFLKPVNKGGNCSTAQLSQMQSSSQEPWLPVDQLSDLRLPYWNRCCQYGEEECAGSSCTIPAQESFQKMAHKSGSAKGLADLKDRLSLSTAQSPRTSVDSVKNKTSSNIGNWSITLKFIPPQNKFFAGSLAPTKWELRDLSYQVENFGNVRVFPYSDDLSAHKPEETKKHDLDDLASNLTTSCSKSSLSLWSNSFGTDSRKTSKLCLNTAIITIYPTLPTCQIRLGCPSSQCIGEKDFPPSNIETDSKCLPDFLQAVKVRKATSFSADEIISHEVLIDVNPYEVRHLPLTLTFTGNGDSCCHLNVLSVELVSDPILNMPSPLLLDKENQEKEVRLFDCGKFATIDSLTDALSKLPLDLSADEQSIDLRLRFECSDWWNRWLSDCSLELDSPIQLPFLLRVEYAANLFDGSCSRSRTLCTRFLADLASASAAPICITQPSLRIIEQRFTKLDKQTDKQLYSRVPLGQPILSGAISVNQSLIFKVSYFFFVFYTYSRIDLKNTEFHFPFFGRRIKYIEIIPVFLFRNILIFLIVEAKSER
ncbi:hypothetical protein Ciccas_007578, partial [Cichlidogyrus casuarinus]